METAIERKRRLRRERILQNSESRMRRILGESASAAATAAVAAAGGSSATDQTETSNHHFQPANVVNNDVDDDVSAFQAAARSNGDVASSSMEKAGGGGGGEYDVSAPPAAALDGAEVNGFHRHLRERASSENVDAFDETPAATAGATNGLEMGAFGFDASKLKKRGGTLNESLTRDAIAVEDEQELRSARNLLFRDRVSEPDLPGFRARGPRAETFAVELNTLQAQAQAQAEADEETPPRVRKVNSSKRSKEDALRNEIERIMHQEHNAQQSAKSSTRANSARRKPVSSLWYTKTWFRTTFAILLALFVRVLMQINLSDHFSDSAFYPFFSMELSFFVAAFCSKPEGYRIPIGGGIVEMVINLLGFSREILGNLKWFYEFAFQKPVEEFSLYFFVFAVSHLILNHVQERASLSHDEL